MVRGISDTHSTNTCCYTKDSLHYHCSCNTFLKFKVLQLQMSNTFNVFDYVYTFVYKAQFKGYGVMSIH